MQVWADGVDKKLLALAEDTTAHPDPRAAALEVLLAMSVGGGDDTLKSFFDTTYPKLAAMVQDRQGVSTEPAFYLTSERLWTATYTLKPFSLVDEQVKIAS